MHKKSMISLTIAMVAAFAAGPARAGDKAAEPGHPVVGDTKYGPKGKKIERMALHSRSIAFNHPHSGKRMVFEAPVPGFFGRLMDKS